MKVTVQDTEIIDNIEPDQLKEYLQSHGWHEDQAFLDNATIWHKQAERGELEILLPNTKNIGDYQPRIREAIAILAAAENLSQMEIFSKFVHDYPNCEIQGLITQIATPNGDKLSGEITVVCRILDNLIKVKIELIERDYILAVKAYQERLPVTCTGDLTKENNIFILKNPQDFQIENI
jgi:hypothetical protein